MGFEYPGEKQDDVWSSCPTQPHPLNAERHAPLFHVVTAFLVSLFSCLAFVLSRHPWSEISIALLPGMPLRVKRRGKYLSWYESGIGYVPTGIFVSMMVLGQKFAGEDA